MEFKAGLGYMDLCLKNTKPNKQTEELDLIQDTGAGPV